MNNRTIQVVWSADGRLLGHRAGGYPQWFWTGKLDHANSIEPAQFEAGAFSWRLLWERWGNRNQVVRGYITEASSTVLPPYLDYYWLAPRTDTSVFYKVHVGTPGYYTLSPVTGEVMIEGVTYTLNDLVELFIE